MNFVQRCIFLRLSSSLFQTQFNGHASPSKYSQNELFSVIEDSFFQEKQGTEKIRKKYVAIDRTKDYETLQFKFERHKPSANNEMLHGYSKIMDARLGVRDQSYPKVIPQSVSNSEVSLASGLGPIKGPEYPHRPSLAPATLQSIVRTTETLQKSFTKAPQPIVRTTETLQKSLTKAPQNSIQVLRSKNKAPKKKFPVKEQTGIYDPFEFQTTQRQQLKAPSPTESISISERHDSRFSIQVIIQTPSDLNSMKFRNQHLRSNLIHNQLYYLMNKLLKSAGVKLSQSEDPTLQNQRHKN